ncbi:MAG TPA: precorrin-6y C5,15-methyltransferase (decarboxylating) subunit CbiE, partial [Desulfobulbaceae bacterium]|nr:precorrin-6y C5,15-methyltransferase (decarboxylating) subunit CbiE [Desulfobulbaceae bacterium]
MSEIFVHGISGGTLSAACIRQLARCAAVVVSKRFAALLPAGAPRRIAIAPVDTMLAEVADALKNGEVTILASGDPLFFGIGRRLIDRFGADRVSFFPALSTLQLACARFKLPWDDLPFLSLHGRSAADIAGRILSRNRVMLFTDQRNSPDRIAADLLQTLRAHGDTGRLKKIRVQVAENLGTKEEKLTCGSLGRIAETVFSPLNMMLVEQELPEENLPVFGLREGEIAHSRGLITKDEVRAVVLHSLRLPRQGVFWDVGGGSGSIAIEA